MKSLKRRVATLDCCCYATTAASITRPTNINAQCKFNSQSRI